MNGESGLRRRTAWIEYVAGGIVPGGPGYASTASLSSKTSGVPGNQSRTSMAKNGAVLNHDGPNRGSPRPEADSITYTRPVKLSVIDRS